ncbi:MAG: peptidase T [Zavarzinella sp.]
MSLDTPTLLERFLRYVQVDTEAKEGSPTYPSTPGQLDLGRMLVNELEEIGLQEVRQSDYGIVTATIPATVSHNAPTIAFIAHLDTSPETSGHGVKPIVHHNYNGEDIVLPGNPSQVIRVAESPDLLKCKGKTIITTDGTTLLGADNKAGVATITEAAAYLMRHPEIPHGPIRVVFTCDEEIGKGVVHVDPKELGCIVGYTLDGAAEGEVEGETFSADKALITFHGKNIHPALAKGKMINSIRMAGMFISKLPPELSPEATEDREGFVHPYVLEGGVALTKLHMLLRDFETPKLSQQADLLRSIASEVEAMYPGSRIDVDIHEQYRNMRDGMVGEPRAMAFAVEATKRAGLEVHQRAIRGGTDGSQLTAKGLPTPNLSTAEHNFHSPLEWTCLEEMQSAVRVIVELSQLWGAETIDE